MSRDTVRRLGRFIPLLGLMIWVVLTPLMATIRHFPIPIVDAYWQ